MIGTKNQVGQSAKFMTLSWLQWLSFITGGYGLGYGLRWLLRYDVVQNQIVGALPLPERRFEFGLFIVAGWLIAGLLLQFGLRKGYRPNPILFALNLMIPVVSLYSEWRYHWLDNVALATGFALSIGMVIVSLNLIPDPIWHKANAVLHHPKLVVRTLTITTLILIITALFRHFAYESSALDMGLMEQIIWNAAKGNGLEGTLIKTQPSHFLGHHWSPILYGLVPVYWLFSSPITLLIVQAAAVMGGVWCFYQMALGQTQNLTVARLVMLFLALNPLLHRALLFDFHQDALGFFFIALALFFFSRQRWLLFGGAWLISLQCKEEIAIYWMAIGLFYTVWRGRPRTSLAFAGLNGLWLALVLTVFMPLFQDGGETASLVLRFEHLGGIYTPAMLTTNPIYALHVLLTWPRIGGVIGILLPVAVLLWRNKGVLWLLLLPLCINLLSNAGEQHMFLRHYALLPLAVIPLMVIVGFESWQIQPAIRNRFGRFSVLAFLILFLWLSPFGLRMGVETIARYAPLSRHVTTRAMLGNIPAEVPVVAQNNLLPHLSDRTYITIYGHEWPVSAEYIALDLESSAWPLPACAYADSIPDLLQSDAYGPIFMQDNLLLFKRGAPRQAVPEATQMVERWRENLPSMRIYCP